MNTDRVIDALGKILEDPYQARDAKYEATAEEVAKKMLPGRVLELLPRLPPPRSLSGRSRTQSSWTTGRVSPPTTSGVTRWTGAGGLLPPQGRRGDGERNGPGQRVCKLSGWGSTSPS